MKVNMNPSSKLAQEHFSQGLNCAQSVFVAFATQYGMEKATALKLASPLGGGISRRGEVCGAVTGALLALGLVHGADTPEGKEDAYQMGQEFLQRFEAEHGAILCRELLDCDMTNPEERQKARDRGAFATLCPLFVGDAAEIAQAMIEAGKK